MVRNKMVWVSLLVAFTLLETVSSASDRPRPLHIRVAVLRDFPPQYSMSDGGRPQGFAIDIFEEIAEIADLEIEYLIKDTWSEVFESVRSGQADLIPNQGITDKRKKWFAFSLPVETFPVSIFTREHRKDIRNISTLSDKHVAVVKLNVGETLMEKQPNVFLEKYDDVQEALFALLSGNVDAFVFPEPVVMKYAREARIEDRIKVVGSPLIEIRRGISVAKENTALLNKINMAVKTLLGSARYKEIYSKWYGQPSPFWTVKKVAASMGAMSVLIVVIMGFWRYRSVIRLNRELKENIAKREFAEHELQQSYENLERKVDERTQELQKALSEVRVLSGLLPICSFCKKIRDDEGYWNQLESYVGKYSEARFSHGVCPECMKEHYGDVIDSEGL